MKKRIIALLMVMAFIATMLPMTAMTVSAAAGEITIASISNGAEVLIVPITSDTAKSGWNKLTAAQITEIDLYSADGETTPAAITIDGIDINTGKFYISGTAATAEEIAAQVKGYSVKAGTWVEFKADKWEKAYKSFLKKGGTLQITNALTSKKKLVDGVAFTPGEAAVSAGTTASDAPADATGTPAIPAVPAIPGVTPSYVVTFAKIDAAPAAPKLVVNYTALAFNDTSDGDWATAQYGVWTLGDKTKNGAALAVADLEKYAICRPADNKKIAAGDTWSVMSDDASENAEVAIKPIGPNEKVGGKYTYFVKVLPFKTEAASGDDKFTPSPLKDVKLGVLSAGKAPKVKADYKNNVLKVKAGLQIWGRGDGSTAFSKIYVKDAAAKTELDKLDNFKDAAVSAVPAKDAMPTLVAIVGTGDKYDLKVRFNATAKKPASLVQTIKIPDISGSPATGMFSFDGKKFTIDSTVQVKFPVSDTAKWGKGLKGFTPGTNFEFDARIASTAKAEKGEDNIYEDSGNRAGNVVTFTVTWGGDADAGWTATVAEK